MNPPEVVAAVTPDGHPLCTRAPEYARWLEHSGFLVVGITAYVLATRWHWLPNSWLVAILIIVTAEGVAWFTHWVFFARRQRKLKGRVKRHSGLVCLKCAYVLDGLSSCGRCPECGAAYEIEQNQRIWNEWVRNVF